MTKLKSLLKNDRLYSIICGLFFVLIFFLCSKYIPSSYYLNRDDGIITLSHAKNWVDYGFIGVSPSGEKIEGFSAPVEFLLYSLCYFLFKMDYTVFTNLQIYTSTFIIGYVFSLFFENKITKLILSICIAYALTRFRSFFEWHYSGMENAITHALFILTIFCFYNMYKSGKIPLYLSLIPFFASISRVEGIYHIFPILVVFSFFFFQRYHSKNVYKLFFAVISLWIIFNLCRYIYFGDIQPNTTYAQGISVFNRLKNIFSIHSDTIMLNISYQLLRYHGVFLLGIIFPLMLFIKLRKENLLLVCLCFSLVLTCLFNPFLFGPTRLDVTRSTTQMLIAVFIIVGVVIYEVIHFYKISNLIKFGIILPSAIIGIFLIKSNFVPNYNLCCAINGFENVYNNFMKLSRENNISRPTTSNPDLGILSYHKKLNTIDLGMLGSSLMAKIQNNELMSFYYLNYGLPDFIETHNSWTCRYFNTIFSTNKFNQLYSLTNKSNGSFSCGSTKVPGGILFYIRNDIKKDSDSAERIFLNKLEKKLNLDVVSKELIDCKNKNNNCSYISRSIYKFIPEFREQNKIQELLELFRTYSSSYAYDEYLINGFSKNTSSKVIEFIINDFIDKEHNIPIQHLDDDYELASTKSSLYVKKKNCSSFEKLLEFKLTVNYKGKNNFQTKTTYKLGQFYKLGSNCYLIQDLPNSSIETIQYKFSNLFNNNLLEGDLTLSQK